MIQVEIKKKNKIEEVWIHGHSGYQDKGKDIVCASASCIAITTINAILKLEEDALTYQEDDGELKLTIKKHNQYIDTLLENMIDLFKELRESYPNYIQIKGGAQWND